MQVLVCIDDTDRLGGRGTGALGAQLIAELEEKGWGRCEPITRHQLFVHPDIPYTSHNSAMCFSLTTDAGFLDLIIEHAQSLLERESAEGADPGLCVAVLDRLLEPGRLVAFGYEAKKTVLKKEDAYALAEKLNVHLSEHGGTGQGVIGALAGVGLRLGCNDGRFKGKHEIAPVGTIMTVDELVRRTGVAIVKSISGTVPSPDDTVRIGEKVKSILHLGKNCLLLSPNSDPGCPARWETCPRAFLDRY